MMTKQHNYNVNLVLCESFDKSTMSINNIFNEVIIKNIYEEIKITILTFFGYIGNEEQKLHFDYFMAPIAPSNTVYRDLVLPLFTSEVNIRKKNPSDDEIDYSVLNDISVQSLEVSFPQEGVYELKVYENLYLDEENPIKRYKKYMEQEQAVVTSIRFKVRKP